MKMPRFWLWMEFKWLSYKVACNEHSIEGIQSVIYKIASEIKEQRARLDVLEDKIKAAIMEDNQ